MFGGRDPRFGRRDRAQCLEIAYRASGRGCCKHKQSGKCFTKRLILQEIFGAGEGIRTLDPNLGKVVLYP
jgi:hypothetical protein